MGKCKTFTEWYNNVNSDTCHRYTTRKSAMFYASLSKITNTHGGKTSNPAK